MLITDMWNNDAVFWGYDEVDVKALLILLKKGIENTVVVRLSKITPNALNRYSIGRYTEETEPTMIMFFRDLSSA